MHRRIPALTLSAAGLLAAAGTSLGALTVTPSDVIMWGHSTGAGRSLAGAQPAGFTWGWRNTGPGSTAIDSNGRVYWIQNLNTTPPTGALTFIAAALTATNSTDMATFDNLRDTGVHANSGFTVGNSAVSSRGLQSSSMRVSGSRVAVGVQFYGNGTNETSPNNDNSGMFTGDYAGGTNVANRRWDGITLNDVNGVPTATNINTVYNSISQQNSEINSSGTVLAGMAVNAVAGVFVTTANAAAAPFGNTGFLGTKTVGGGYTVIAQGGGTNTGVGGTHWQNGGVTGINGFFAKINRNGQVAFDGKLGTTFPVTTGTDDVMYINTPGMGNTLVRREGQAAPDATGAPDIGGALYNNAAQTHPRGFSTAGIFFGSDLTGGDVDTTVGQQTNYGAYIATTSGTTRVFRRNDQVPGMPANTRYGLMGSSNSCFNNSGQLAFGASLQGTAVTPSVQFQWNQFGNGLITVPGVQGNADAFIAGPANNLQVIARTGDPAPGFPNLYLSVTTSNGSLIQNNAGEVMFTSALTPYAAGASIGVVGQTPAASVLTTPFNTVLWGWSSGFGLVPLLYGGQMIEVDPGVFKKISTISTNNADNGDGGSSELNDSGIFAVQVTFTDTSYSIIKLQIPAPGTGAMALLGLGALARRRRK